MPATQTTAKGNDPVATNPAVETASSAPLAHSAGTAARLASHLVPSPAGAGQVPAG